MSAAIDRCDGGLSGEEATATILNSMRLLVLLAY